MEAGEERQAKEKISKNINGTGGVYDEITTDINGENMCIGPILWDKSTDKKEYL